MNFFHGVLALLVTISVMDTVRPDLMDIALPTMFGSKEKKYMSCYDCINVTNSDCNTIPPNSTSFVKVCDDGANGCVKKFYHDDGYTIMSRECYYGPVKFYRDFRCEGTKINFSHEKCHLCTEDLCNSSINLYSPSHTWPILVMCLLLQAYYMI